MFNSYLLSVPPWALVCIAVMFLVAAVLLQVVGLFRRNSRTTLSALAAIALVGALGAALAGALQLKSLGSSPSTWVADWKRKTAPPALPAELKKEWGVVILAAQMQSDQLRFDEYVDYGDDGFAEKTEWPAQQGAIVLGVASATHGKAYPLPVWGADQAAALGRLKAYDSNGDARIDARDTEWNKLRLLTTAVKFEPLAQQFVAIDLPGAATSTPRLVRPDGGVERARWVRVARASAQTMDLNSVQPDRRVFELFEVNGMGEVPSFTQAMTRDPVLLSMAEEFVKLKDLAVLEERFESLFLRWARADGVVPDSRGPHMDARRLVALEHFHGQPYHGHAGPNPVKGAAALLETAYADLKTKAFAHAVLRGAVRDFSDLMETYTTPMGADLEWGKVIQHAKLPQDEARFALFARAIRYTVKGKAYEEFRQAVAAQRPELMPLMP